MTTEQIQSARTLLTQPENSVSSIAKLLGVSRSTIYKYVPELTKQPTLPLEPEQQQAATIIEAPQPASEPAPAGRGPACPTCDYRPTHSRELELHRDGLATIWLTLDPDHPGRVIERRHCERCQPHRARIVMCGLFDTTVMLGDDLAVPEPSPLPRPAAQWLTTNAWKQHGDGWYCGKHTKTSEASDAWPQWGRRAFQYSPKACRIVAQSPKSAREFANASTEVQLVPGISEPAVTCGVGELNGRGGVAPGPLPRGTAKRRPDSS